MNCTQKQKAIEAWLSNIQELSEFHCKIYDDSWIYDETRYSANEYGDPLSPYCLTQFWEVEDYLPACTLVFSISDIEGRGMMLDVPLDGVTGPSASFFDKKRNIGFDAELDLSIIDYIYSLIERFPAIFFQDHLHAAVYYSQNNNTIKAFDELRPHSPISVKSGVVYFKMD